MYRSINTVRVDVARKRFDSMGQGIIWAIVSSGIDHSHRHFSKHATLDLGSGLTHHDFTSDAAPGSALTDEFGNGTYIAGLVAGEVTEGDGGVVAATNALREDGSEAYERTPVSAISGMAPRCKLISMKVLDSDGHGQVSTVIEALRAIQEINEYGRALRIHGVLLSLGFGYDPERFSCGLSPLCMEVDRLSRSGVVMVCAAGNRGYGYVNSLGRTSGSGLEASIDDPGNAESAITVGSTHRELPQLYGVSYFSGKGPTVDGRNKPDLVAPGEHIVSCAAGKTSQVAREVVSDYTYIEESGTSGSSAHIAGMIAAFLSTRREFIGKPDAVKEIFVRTASDLGRDRNYQGSGLADLNSALEASHSAEARVKRVPAKVNVKDSSQPRSEVRPLRLVFSYSRKDATLRKELEVYLAPLNRQGLIQGWYDGQITAGDEWRREIADKLEEADLIVLLISADFLASDFCYEIEMKRALERHDAAEARVIPVIVRPSDWSSAPFSKLQVLPQEATPVTSWENQDAAWNDVAMGIRRAVEQMRG